MSRKTVRVDIPTGSPEVLLKLGLAIKAKHDKDGATSPLDTKKMTALGAALAIAGPKNQEAKDADGLAQTARQARDTSLGVADGQSVNTKDTALNLITYARDQLLLTYDGSEEALTGYGFNVVVGAAKTRTAKPAAK